MPALMRSRHVRTRVKVARGHRSELRIRRSGDLLASPLNPRGILGGKAIKGLPRRSEAIVRQCRECSHGELKPVSLRVCDVRGHAWELHGGQNISEEECRCLARFGIPAGSAAMANSPRRGFAIEQGQRLFLRVELIERPLTLWVFLDMSAAGQNLEIALVENALVRLLA